MTCNGLIKVLNWIEEGFACLATNPFYHDLDIVVAK